LLKPNKSITEAIGLQASFSRPRKPIAKSAVTVRSKPSLCPIEQQASQTAHLTDPRCGEPQKT